MYIAYSALRSAKHIAKHRSSARYRGYMAACNKHQQTIAAIQQYMPGWQPTEPVYKQVDLIK